jgi:DNA-binding IclR family transcriptional regulator
VEIRSVTKAVRLLNVISEESGPVGVSDLARRLGIDKSSASRLLRTLEQSDLVSQDEATRGYTLGLHLFHLGQKVARRLDVRRIAASSLAALVERTHECSHLAILSGDRALYIDQAAPQRGVSFDAPVGTLAPLHCTALGKALLAFQPQIRLDALIDKMALETFTRRTLRDGNSLRTHLAEVRQQGVAFDDEEFSVGVRCVAAPVFRYDGSVAGAIGISGPSPRVTDDRIRDWTPFILEQARGLSLQMGWAAEQAA